MNSQDTNPQQLAEEQQIVRNIAGLPKETEITFIDTGWDSRVYSFTQGSEKFFVKFPRSEKIQGRYAQEIAALDVARNLRANIALPEILWRDENNAYFGYKGVPGAPLSEQITLLDRAEKQAIGTALGNFLKQFHTQTIIGARNVSVNKEIAQFQEWYEPAKAVLQARFTAHEQHTLETLIFETWPKHMRELGRTQALCHGDLHLKNIMYADGSIGIIDFGDVALYDCSKDLIDFEDEDIFDSAIRAYGDSDMLRQKIAVRTNTLHIIGLTYNIKKQNREGIERQIRALKKLVI